jgi:hypothetical protein
MNDFLVKPFKIEELRDISEYWFREIPKDVSNN